MLKEFKNSKDFLNINDETSLTNTAQKIYNEVYSTTKGFEALIPFKLVENPNQKIIRRKPLEFKKITDEKSNKIYKQEKSIFTEYPIVEEHYTIENSFSIERKYLSLETLTPELITSGLLEVANAETQYKRKAFLDTAKEAPKLILKDKLNLRKDALQIHDKIIDHCYEMGMNIENLWIFSDIELNRGFRDQLQLTVGATKQIQDVIDGKGVSLYRIQSSVEKINYVGIPKLVSLLDSQGKSRVITNLLPENTIAYIV